MMAYQASPAGSFVTSIIHNKKPLRESNVGNQRTVFLPFDSEYSIRVKSKSKLRAKVHISIDGTDILMPGKALLLEAGAELDVERFILDSLTEGKKFKFVSAEKGAASGEVQDPTSPLNGLVKVEVYEEIETPKVTYPICDTNDRYAKSGGRNHMRSMGLSEKSRGFSGSEVKCSANAGATVEANATFMSNASPQINDIGYVDREEKERALYDSSPVGATAQGSQSSQIFQETWTDFKIQAVPVTFEIWLRAPEATVQKPEPCTKKYLIVFNDAGVKVSSLGKALRAHRVDVDDTIATIRLERGEIKTRDFEVRHE